MQFQKSDQSLAYNQRCQYVFVGTKAAQLSLMR
jgi:hypothetical protein